MVHFFREIVLMFKEASLEWMDDNAFRLSASLAYYTLFSMAPLLIISIAVAGAFFQNINTDYIDFRDHTPQAEILRQVEYLIGKEGADVIKTAIDNANRKNGSLTVASIVGLLLFAFAATNVFAELQDALNTVWGVRLKPGFGVKGFVRTRLLSFTIVLGIGFLLLVSLLISALLSALGKYMEYLLPSNEIFVQTMHFCISFTVITILFAMLFKFLPDVIIHWTDVWVGAVVTSLLFTSGKLLIGLYLGKGGFASTFGAAGSMVILLAWVYYSALIFFLGAELTLVYSRKFGSKIVPNELSERILHKDRVKRDKPRTDEVEQNLL